jgi:antitoxin component YwqK of YwqJK toxin-antitoxin module
MKKIHFNRIATSIITLLLLIGCETNSHKIYYPNSSKLMAEYGMKEGKREGIQKTYFEDGNLHEEYEMQGDSATGYYKSYYSSGKLEFECSKVNGKINGRSKSYFENGKMRAEVNSILGERNGGFKIYDKKGYLINEGFFKDDKQDSLITNYYPDGKVKIKQMWKNDIQEGPFQSFFTNGKLYVNSVFHNDICVYSQQFNENGSLVSEDRLFDIVPASDTIYLGEVYSGEIKIYGPTSEDVCIKAGLMKKDPDLKALKVLTVKEMSAYFSFLPKEPGVFYLEVQESSKTNRWKTVSEMKKLVVSKK